MNKPTTELETRANGAKESVAQFQSELIKPWAEATNRCARAALDWGAETIRFAGHRLERTRRTLDQLPTCGSWEEVANAHMNWTRDLIQDYLDQGSQIMEIAQRASEPLGGPAKRGQGNGSKRASR